MRLRRMIPALVVIAAMVFAACGSDSENDSASKEAPDKAGPVKVVFLWEVKGESEVAVDDYNNGAILAVEQINAAGGIDGRKIEVTRISTPVFDTQKANAAFLKALDEEPTAIIGFALEAQVRGSIPNITRGRVPVITPTPGGDNVRYGAEGGSEFAWWMNYNGAVGQAAIEYLTDDLGLDKIALLGDTGDYGSAFIDYGEKFLGDKDLEPATVQTLAPDATDLTRQVLAVKGSGADGAMNASPPNPLSVQLKQFRQNGLAIPTITGGSAPYVVNYKMAEGDALKDFYGVEPCNFTATGNNDPAATKFAEEYQKRFPDAGPPSAGAGYTHDALYVLKAAVEKAGSTDPVEVNRALDEIDVTDGVVCRPRYRADGSHFLLRGGVVVSYGPDSPPGKIVKTFDFPPLPKA